MKIQTNQKMDSFFDRCLKNMQACALNNYLGATVLKSDESNMQQALRKAGAQEFSGPKENWPSLFLSSKAWEKSPYHQSIHLEGINDEHFSYVKEPVLANELFNVDVIQKDKNRELADWMKLRALDEPVEAIYLLQDGYDWMLDAPSEALTNDPYAKKAHGNVITFGLGIGYFVFMALRNPNVDSITVVEQSKEVIDLFNTYLKPQFVTNKPINIIQNDAFVCFNEEFLKPFDYIYVDIWQSGEDGLFAIEALLESYQPPFEDVDFWIEDSCFNPIWSLIFIHFDEIYHKRNNTVYEDYLGIMNKIRAYFKQIDETIEDPEQLKFYMYDNQTIRQILSSK